MKLHGQQSTPETPPKSLVPLKTSQKAKRLARKDLQSKANNGRSIDLSSAAKQKNNLQHSNSKLGSPPVSVKNHIHHPTPPCQQPARAVPPDESSPNDKVVPVVSPSKST